MAVTMDKALMPGSNTPNPPASQIHRCPGCQTRTSSRQTFAAERMRLPSSQARAGPTAGAGYELTVLAAAIIGGVQLTGGRGSIIGVLLGLCVIGIIQNLIVLWGISPNWTQGVSGIVLIAAVTVTWLTRRDQGKANPIARG